MSDTPERIWIQLSDGLVSEEYSTWCGDKVETNDVEYISREWLEDQIAERIEKCGTHAIITCRTYREVLELIAGEE